MTAKPSTWFVAVVVLAMVLVACIGTAGETPTTQPTPAIFTATPGQEPTRPLTPTEAAGGITPSPPGAPQVVKLFEETSYYLKDVAFVNADVGWAVGEPHWNQTEKRYKGTIIKTTDAGEAWTAQEAGVTAGYRGVCFVDANHGWVVGTNGTILHTGDGGDHWVKQTVATSDEFRGVFFTDASTGWATSVEILRSEEPYEDWRASIWHTDDGGETWVQQALPDNASILNRIDFVDSQTGWVAGVKRIEDDEFGSPQHVGAIYHTTDGGRTWSEQYSPELEITFTGVDFVDAMHGWVVGFPTRSDIEGGSVFHTTDGGKTWERQEPGDIFAPLWDVQFVDQNRGYAVGFNYAAAWGPPVWRTLDGGATWTSIKMEKLNPLTTEGLFAVALVGDQVIAVGDYDYVAKSTQAWDSCEGLVRCRNCECLFRQYYINTHYIFHDVFFADEAHGWVVGSQTFDVNLWGQVILHTRDGGDTWETQYEHAPPDTLFSVHRLASVYFTDNQNGWAVGRAEFYGYDQEWPYR